MPVTPPAQQIAAEVSALLAARINPAGPGVAVLVARGDTLLFRGARGMASIELGVPLSTDQVFRIGSVTKQFSAAALLQQVDDGKAGLNDPLARFRPDFPGGQTITLAQLLNHTSGVKSYTGVPGYVTGAARRGATSARPSSSPASKTCRWTFHRARPGPTTTRATCWRARSSKR